MKWYVEKKKGHLGKHTVATLHCMFTLSLALQQSLVVIDFLSVNIEIVPY